MKLVIGGGYLGMRVAKAWRDQGRTVAVLTRKHSRADELRDAGYMPLIGDVTDPDSLAVLSDQLTELDCVLYAVGFDRQAGPAMREVYVAGLRNALDKLPDSTRRIIYISSTGVYSQNDGGSIDETSPAEPVREGGQVCLEAEQALQQHPLGQRSIVLRLAGIYGPGRTLKQADLIAGKPVSAAPEGYLNLIHVDDAVGIVMAVDESAQPADLYLVSDGNPVLRRDFYAEAAQLLGAPAPVFQSPDDASSSRRGNTDKRVSNALLRHELRYSFLFPSYREGLRASISTASH